MNASLLVLAAWLSAALAPLDPKQDKVPTPDSEQAHMPAPAKPPAITRPAKITLKSGAYALDSLKRPEVIKMEALETWSQGAAWPQVDRPVVVITHSDDDPQRFLAFLVDVQNQRIAAIRDGDTYRHLPILGQHQNVAVPDKYSSGNTPTTLGKAGSGAVIIMLPPRPVGPRGLPDDFTAMILDVATVAGSASQWPFSGPIKGL